MKILNEDSDWKVLARKYKKQDSVTSLLSSEEQRVEAIEEEGADSYICSIRRVKFSFHFLCSTVSEFFKKRFPPLLLFLLTSSNFYFHNFDAIPC